MSAPPRYTRRDVMRAAGGVATTSVLGGSVPWLGRAAAAPTIRAPDSLPDPRRPAGEPTDTMPFDHIVCLMQENHSFDNYFGMLPRRGQPAADGFTFDASGAPTNSNPVVGGIVRVTHSPTVCQPPGVSQAWTPTHEEVDSGRMDGFAKVNQGQMYYYDESDIPFYYSFAKTFTVGNRWFCSAPCQTYPNRRFYLAGTAFGLISTTTSSVTHSPPNGTIVDRLNAHKISWKDYFVDVPGTAVIFDIPRKNPLNMAPIAEFFLDCAAGTLPSVSFVDPEIGLLNEVGSRLAGAVPIGNGLAQFVAAQDQDEENPADIQLGESFVQQVVDAVVKSPLWPRTLIVFTYDEHGGYYDHVPPPAAIPPDAIKPVLGTNDIQGGYDVYGPRVPAVVASPYSKPNGVSNAICDHTSVLATIEAKWNLPACTFRDANANTVMSFLDTRKPALLEPPKLAGAGDLLPGETNCKPVNPKLPVRPAPPPSHGTGRLVLEVNGANRAGDGIVVDLASTSGVIAGVTVDLLRGRTIVARRRVSRVSTHRTRVVVRAHHRLARGRYIVRVLQHGETLAQHHARVR